jgi:hypothetical protein
MGETQIQAKLDLHPRKQLAQVFSFLKQFIIQTNYNLCKEKKNYPKNCSRIHSTNYPTNNLTSSTSHPKNRGKPRGTAETTGSKTQSVDQ